MPKKKPSRSAPRPKVVLPSTARRSALDTVAVPPEIAPLFLKAQDYVAKYFSDRVEDPRHSTITISGERYILVRAASMSVEFFEMVRSLYRDQGVDEARSVASNILFDIAHATGKADARAFQSRMGVTEPIEKLSAGPIHFAYAGWAFVKIDAASRPTPDENYYLIFDHPFSFESDAWLKHNHGKPVDFHVCVMNAGYSSGWCEESFGIPLVSVEIECMARGDAQCRFIMAPPNRIEEHLNRYVASSGKQSGKRKAGPIAIPEFFQRKRMEEDLREAHALLEQRVIERTANLRTANELLWQEVEQRKEAEDALRMANERFELAGRASGSIIFEVDIRTRTIVTAIGVEEVLGYKQQAIGPSVDWWLERVHPEDRPIVDREIEVVRKGGDFFAEYRLRAQDGRYRQIWDRGLILRDIHGAPLRAVGVLIDVTDRKQLEMELRQAQKMEAVGRLAGGIAHDFNNLLTVIHGYSELLSLNAEDPDKVRTQIQHIRKAVDRAVTLTRQLLTFSRRHSPTTENLKLNAVITNITELLVPLLGPNIELRTDLAPEAGYISGNHGQLEQVIMNLAVNARDAMPKGGALTITSQNQRLEHDLIRSNFKVPRGEYVVMNVSDDGTGMDEETCAHVFEPFFTTKEQGRGTGLGLATVYGIVKQGGGFIWVESIVGRGSTFTVYLPRIFEGKEAGEVPPAPVVMAEAELAQGTGRTVLLVEDEPSIRSLVAELLRKSGYFVLEAGNGMEGVAVSKGHRGRIELLLTDIVMPQMNGREMALQVRGKRPETRVLYVSGYNDVLPPECLEEPGSAYIQKPFSNAVLLKMISELLEPSPQESLP